MRTLCMIAAAFLVPGAAGASEDVIDFETLPDGSTPHEMTYWHIYQPMIEKLSVEIGGQLAGSFHWDFFLHGNHCRNTSIHKFWP